MNRRETMSGLLLLASGALAVGAGAQQTARTARIGVLGNNLAASPRAVEAFRRRLAELGYVEGRNVVIVLSSADGNPERLPVLASELVARNADVIVATGGGMAAVAARNATAVTPIVFIAVGDPVGLGLVASLARPGGNATGLSSQFPDAVPKLVELVRETLPGAKRVALLVDKGAPSTGSGARTAETAGRAVGIRIEEVKIDGRDDFGPILAALATSGIGAVIVFGSPTMLGRRRQLAEAAAASRLPLVSALREYVDAGALMSYGPDLSEMFAAAAVYVDRILKGTSPAVLPVEQPTRLALVVNRATAAALGITIPKSVLARAVE